MSPDHSRAALKHVMFAFAIAQVFAGLLGAQDECRLPVAKGDRVEVHFGSEVRTTGSLSCHPNLPMAAVGLRGGYIRIFDVTTGEGLALWHANVSPGSSLVYSPDGGLLLSTTADGDARVWDSRSGRELETLAVSRRGDPHGAVIRLEFSPDGSRLMSDDRGYGITLWDTESWTRIAGFGGGQVMAGSLAWSSDSELFAMVDLKGEAFVWSTQSGELRSGPMVQGHVGSHVAFQPGGHLLAVACEDLMVRVWDLETEQVLMDLEQPHLSRGSYHLAVEFSPDGRRLLVSHGAGYVSCWEVATWERAWGKDYWAAGFGRFPVRYVADGTQILVEGNLGMGQLLITPSLHYSGTPSVAGGVSLRIGDSTGSLARYRSVLFDPQQVRLAAGGEELGRPPLDH